MTSISAILVGAAVSAPAAADPASGEFGQLRVFGSDTTQDIMQGLAGAVNAQAGENLLANYLAIGSGSLTVQIDSAGTLAPRANGSSAGRDFLRVAIGQTATATVARPGGSANNYTATVADVGKIEVARSSSRPPGAQEAANGVLTYVPFAKDALTMAVKDGSPLAVVPWYIGRGESTTSKPNLTAVYQGAVTHAYVAGGPGSYTYVGVGNSADVPAGSPEGTVAYALRPVIPQAGSGTRSYFIVDVLGLTDGSGSAIPAGIRSSVVEIGGTSYSVQEHDGLVMGLDETIIGPFSIGQYVAFTNEVPGVTDRRRGAVLLPLKATEAATAAAPFVTVGGGPLVKANPDFTAATRDVYNIVPSRLLDDPSTVIHEVFNGSDSLLCQQTATIELYGFLPINNCGADSLRAYAPNADNTSTIEWTPPTGLEVGESTDVPVTVDSKVHRQGGVVRILRGTEVVGQATVAPHPGSATSTVQVPVSVTTTDSSVALQAVFIPTLPGVTGSSTSVANVPVTSPTSTFISTRSTATVGDFLTVVGWVNGAEGGSVELWDGTTLLQTYTLDADESGYGFRTVANKLSYALEVRYVPPAGSNLAASSSTVRTVTVSKATPTVRGTAASVRAGTRGKIVVTVAAINGVVPTGRVEVFRGSTRVGSGNLSNGRVVITMALIPRGTHTLSVRYLGNTLFEARNTTARFVVR